MLWRKRQVRDFERGQSASTSTALAMHLRLVETMERRRLLSGNMLVFTIPPTSTDAGAQIDAPTGVQVTVESGSGQTVTNDSDSVTLALGSNAGAATLGGTLTVSAVNGVATFQSVSISVPANGYSLTATDTSNSTVSSAVSPVFNVNARAVFSSLSSLASGPNGVNPQGDLIIDGNGDIFGTTSSGGLYGDGTVYELSGPNHTTLTTLVSFSGTTGPAPGSEPVAGLTLDASGNLHGTTSGGGASNNGTVFELSGADHAQFTSLVSFTGDAGNYPGNHPSGSVTLVGADLYGTTYYGGSAGSGTIFELSGPNYGTFTSLISFTISQPYPEYPIGYPSGTLTADSNGNLYGTASASTYPTDGGIFELSGTTHTDLTVLATFTGTSGSEPGDRPTGKLIIDGNGNLYGTTSEGGASNYGTVFELSGQSHTTFTSLVSFTGSSGSYLGDLPECGLTFDSEGDLFGTTGSGGASWDGTVFELSGPNHTTFESLDSFPALASDGGSPEGALAIDSNGNLYGAAYTGGAYDGGAIFTIPASNRYDATTLFELVSPNGNTP